MIAQSEGPCGGRAVTSRRLVWVWEYVGFSLGGLSGRILLHTLHEFQELCGFKVIYII